MARIQIHQMYRFVDRQNDRTQPPRDDDRFPADFTDHERGIWFATWQALFAFCPDGQRGEA